MTLRRTLPIVLTVACVFILALLLMVQPPAAAQDPGTATPPPDNADVLERANDALDDADALNDRTDDVLARTDNILNVVNIIFAILAVFGLLGGAAAFVGVRNVRDINQESRDAIHELQTESREEIEKVEDVATRSIKEIEQLVSRYEQDEQVLRDERTKLEQALARLEEDIQTVELLKTEIESRLETVRTDLANSLKRTEQLGIGLAKGLSLAQLAQQQIGWSNFQTAREVLEEAKNEAGDNTVVYYFLGDVCVRLGDIEEGVRYLNMARSPERDTPWADASYAYALRLKGDDFEDRRSAENQYDPNEFYKESETIFIRLFKKHPHLLDIAGESAYGALGGIYRRTGELDKAVYYYKHAVEITGDRSYPLNNLGLLSARQGNMAGAEGFFQRSYRAANRKFMMMPDDYWALFDLVTAGLFLKKFPVPAHTTDLLTEELRALLDEAIRLVEDHTIPLEKLVLGLRELMETPLDLDTRAQIMAVIEYLERAIRLPAEAIHGDGPRG